MKKIITVLMVMTLIFAGVSVVGAARGGFYGRGGMGPGYSMGYGAGYSGNQNHLDLSDEQQEKLQEINENFFAKRDELREQLWDTNQKLKELVYSDTSAEEVDNLRNQINSLQTEMNNLRFSHNDEIKAVLTEEQLTKFEEYFNGNPGQNNSQSYGPGFMGGPGGYGHMGFRGYGPGSMMGSGNFRGYAPMGRGWCY